MPTRPERPERGQPDAAAADDGDGGADRNPSRVDDRTEAGGDRAADDGSAVERDV